ncbi:hypothetical protein RhiirA4_456316 [Rhizophagus irregularis]|uniref:Uncharacterized protein n=1 Tax=Rhizophagus irregularis TaxID=588596 RepID=A0A2I1G777_9GLOM|nr:hypothetical protein RhiirA4_456316 [Rhizophagus irregularis]
MGAELKLAKFEIKIIEYGDESVNLKSLIDQAVIKGLIVYEDYDFLPYPINVPQPDSDFFNLFLGFLAKLATKINKEIMDPILCGEWHRFNGHLKSLITEGKVSIECKGLETKRLKDFAGYIVTSNQDAPIKIDIGDSRVVCFDVSSRCRGNTAYFKRLGKVLDHPDAPGVVMRYLLSLDLSDFEPQEIPATKMKSNTMRNHLPNPIWFIINYISLWDVDKVAKLSSTSLYQNYLEWCGENGEKPLTNNILGQKFAQIGIDKVRSRDNGVRVNQYILDRPKIVAKLRESGLGDIEEFSDIPQPEALKADDLPENETTDIPIFNKVDKQDESTQLLFDYVAKDIRAPVASTSGTSEASKTSELFNKSETSKPPKPIEPIRIEADMPPKETPTDSFKPINELSSAILLARAQREERLRKKAVELGEDPDVFITITKKDRLDSIAFRDKMETDSRVCGYLKEAEEDPKEHMDMTVRERLIREEIIRRELEDDGVTSSWLDTDEEWKKTVSILQENGMLW